MGEDNKKSFWSSMPGILTGIASVIGVIITLITTLHLVPVSTNTNTNVTSQSSSLPQAKQNISSPSNQIPNTCGTKLLGINILGKWNWGGTNNGKTQSGIITFKSDCTYTNIDTSGSSENTNGHFSISGPSPIIIKLHNNFNKGQSYLVNKIYNDYYHLYDLNNNVNLNLFRSS